LGLSWVELSWGHGGGKTSISALGKLVFFSG
jgi:hypothetical protein